MGCKRKIYKGLASPSLVTALKAHQSILNEAGFLEKASNMNDQIRELEKESDALNQELINKQNSFHSKCLIQSLQSYIWDLRMAGKEKRPSKWILN